jgi:hypothetical protein
VLANELLAILLDVVQDVEVQAKKKLGVLIQFTTNNDKKR